MFDKSTASTEFTNVEITSNGTRAGTVVKVNGKEVKNLASACLTFYNDDYGNNVYLEFSTRDGDSKSPGTLVNTTYWRLVPPVEEPATAATDVQKFKTVGSLVQGGVDITRHVRGNALREFYKKI